jgi:hypothetical protein
MIIFLTLLPPPPSQPEQQSLLNGSVTLAESVKPYADFTNVQWWDVATKPLLSSTDMATGGFLAALELERVLKGIVDKSSALLKEHFNSQLSNSPEIESQIQMLFTRDFFGSVIGTFEQNAIGIRLRHPIYESLTDGLDYGEREREARHELIVQVASLNDGGGGNDDCEDDMCDDDDCLHDHNDVDAVIGMNQMELEDDEPFTPDDITKVS